MAWFDNQQFAPDGVRPLVQGYQRAKFRDAVFWVNDYSQDAGRRLSIQRFPGDRFTNVQDLGADSTKFTVNAFLVGEDYDTDRVALEQALLKGGEGDLYLPWRGTLTVTIVGRIRTQESKTARGTCTVTFECIETNPPPRVFSVDAAARVGDAADRAESETKRKFGRRFSNTGVPESRRFKVRAGLSDLSNRVVEIQGTISAKIGVIASTTNQVSRLFGSFNSLINTPLELSDAIVDAVVTSYSSARSSVELLRNVLTTWGRGGPIRILADQTFNFADDFSNSRPTVQSTTANGVQENTNLEELYRLAPLASLYETARLYTVLPFESFNQADSIRTRFVDAIDPFLLDASDKEFEAISDLTEAVAAYLSEVAEGLPQIATHTPADTFHAFVVAHHLYGDATQAEDIVDRNRIQHPGFVAQDEPLEVLSDG